MGKLTAKSVQSHIKAALPGRYGDGDGLYLMIPKSGQPYWMLRYTLFGKRRSMTIAKQGELSLAEARANAALLKKKILEEEDPIATRKTKNQVDIRTVDDLFSDWIIGIRKKLQHPKIPERIYQKEIAPDIGRYAIDKVTAFDIRRIIEKVALSDRPTIANDTLMYLKQLLNHGVKLNLISYNCALAFKVEDAGGQEKNRTRALSLDELKRAFRIFAQNSKAFTRENYLACLLLVTLGVRKTELTEAKWTEFDLSKGIWQLPSSRSKTGTEIKIPLPFPVIAWLEELKVRACGSEYVFPSRRSAKNPHMGKDTLNRAIAKMFGNEPGKKKQPPNLMGDLEYFTVHDLRRTCRSLLASLGVAPHIAERCLNHKIKGVEGIYDQYDYFDERKEAISLLASKICTCLSI